LDVNNFDAGAQHLEEFYEPFRISFRYPASYLDAREPAPVI